MDRATDCLNKAHCEICPLGRALRQRGEFAPVPGEINGSDVTIVGPAPGKQDVTHGRVFIGPAGADLVTMLKAAGRRRADVNWANAVACRYPNDDRKSFIARLQKRNRKLRKEGKPEEPTPEACCRPRLDAELEGVPNVVTLGATTIKVFGTRTYTPGSDEPVLEHMPSLDSYRGAPAYTAAGHKLLATRMDWGHNPMWKPIVAKDLARAFRWFGGRLDWVEPEAVFVGGDADAFIDRLEAFIEAHAGGALTYDVETHATKHTEDNKPVFDSRRDALRCIGIGDADTAFILPFKSVEEPERGWRKWFTRAQWKRLLRLLRGFFTRKDIVKAGWNSGYYDRMVIEARLGVTPAPYLDGMVLHKLGMPEYFQGLGATASFYLDAPAWKAEHTAVSARTDAELWFYCARDVCITQRLLPLVKRTAAQAGQVGLYGRRTRVQRLACSMHRQGLAVDEHSRLKHKARLEARKASCASAMRALAEAPNLNPNSVQAQQRVLFEQWDLPVVAYTDTGEPSTKDEALLNLLGDPTLPAHAEKYIDLLRDYRSATTALSYFIDKWGPDSPWVDNGFMHPDWNATGTVGWRLSSRNPTCQNIPYKLRDCFYAGDGYLFVGADYDQLELRYSAALAGAEMYLDAFERNEIDTHNLTGKLVFGQAYWNRDGAPTDPRLKGSGDFKEIRDLIKTFTYAAIFGAVPKTIHGQIIQAKEHRKRSLAEVRAIHNRWKAAVPEYPRWWRQQLDTFRQQGFIEEKVWGLRRPFANGEDYNTVINTEVQFGGCAIVHIGTFRALRALSRAGLIGKDPSTGLVLQGHDAVYFRVRAEDAEDVKAVLDHELVVRVSQLPVTFTAEADISPWLDLCDADTAAERRAERDAA